MSKAILIALTPTQFAAKAAQLKEEAGLDLTGNAGTLAKDGVSAAYSYDGVSTLTVEITHKPFIVPESVVESKLRAWLSA